MTDKFGALTVSLDRGGSAGGSLAGLSFVVKENIDVAGLVSRNGEPAFAASHAPAGLDAPAVNRLLSSGARLVGKTHMDEMAYSLLGANHHLGTPVNPAAPDRHPGGSSSGSAVAVAAGLADFALGTDTAGSCRAPAAFCGIFGFRPSHGAVSSDGVVPLAPALDTIGWFARDATTLKKVGAALLPDDLDMEPFARPLVPMEAFVDCPPTEAALLRPAVDARLKDFFPRDVRLGDDFLSRMQNHFRDFQAFEAHQSHGAWIEAVRPEFGPGVAERFAYAASVTAERKRAADEFRRQARETIDDLLGAEGFFVLPTTPFFAPPLDASELELASRRNQMVRLFQIASFFGLPQVSLPLTTRVAPLGLSLIGRRWTDRGLLALAERLAARL
ncbi:MAG: amidase [Methylocystis sp.]